MNRIVFNSLMPTLKEKNLLDILTKIIQDGIKSTVYSTSNRLIQYVCMCVRKISMYAEY